MNAIPPTQAHFRSSYDAGRGTLVWTTGVADLETPVGAFLKLAHGRPNSFLLESIEGGSARSRYSIIGMDPDLVWRCRGGRAEVNRHARSAPHAFVPDDRPALDSLRALIQEAQLDLPDHLPPMLGGLVGYLGYDMVRLMERLPDKNTDAIGLPEADPDPAHRVRRVRQRAGRADPGRPDLPAARRFRPSRLGPGAGGPGPGRRGAAAPPAPRRPARRACRRSRSRSPT